MPADEEAGWKLVHMIAQTKGEVFIPYHSYLAIMAGKRPYAHAMAMYDVWMGDQGPAKAALVEQTRRAVRQREFDILLLDSGQFLKDWFERTDFEGYCFGGQSTFDNESVFWPVTGMQTRPDIVVDTCAEGADAG
jgi:hypothetical protein